MSYKFVESFRAGPRWSCSEAVSCQNKFVKLVHVVGFIIKKKDAEDYFVFMFFMFYLFEGNKGKQGKLKDIKLIIL
jgi:hypothetical protein